MVWVHLGLFCYGSKVNKKLAELVQLMQRFVPRSRFIISQNDYARSTPIGPLNSCFVAFHSARVELGMFHYGSKLGAKRAECGAIIANVRAIKSHRNFSQQTHLIHPIGS